jgi:hypothetical protein
MIRVMRGMSPALAGAAILFTLSLTAQSSMAGTITEGFEGGSYNLSGQGGGLATVSTTAPVHSGSQALDLSVPTASDYARVKLDVTSSGLTLGAITSADYWVNLMSAKGSNMVPYIIFSIDTPSGGPDDTLAVMWNPHDIGINPAAGVWSDIVVNRDTTLFHVEGDTTGLVNPTLETLDSLSASLYSPGVFWGDFAVDFVRIGLGSAGDDQLLYSYHVDDVSITAADVGVPEPATLALFGAGIAGVGALRRRRKAKALAE